MLLPTLSIVPTLLAIAFVAICVLMILVILIQKPKGGGLGSAFGGGGGGGSENAAFGAKTGDVLTWVTVGCFVCFLLLAMGLTWTIRAEVAPAPIVPAQQQQTTTGTTTPESAPAPADDADTDADAEGEAQPDADGNVRQPQQTPVAPAPELAEPSNDTADEALPTSPEQPEVTDEAEPTDAE